MEFVKPLLDALKLSPRYFVALAALSGFVLFAPQQALEFLGIAQLAEDHRAVLGAVFLVSCTLSAMALCAWCVRLVAGVRAQRKMQAMVTKRLSSLTEDEKQILRYYIGHQTRTNYLDISDGVVQGLISARILFRAAAVSREYTVFAVNISAQAWQMLNEDQSMLIGSTNIARIDLDSGY